MKGLLQMEGGGEVLKRKWGLWKSESAARWTEGVSSWAVTTGEGLEVCICEGREGERRVPQR